MKKDALLLFLLFACMMKEALLLLLLVTCARSHMPPHPPLPLPAPSLRSVARLGWAHVQLDVGARDDGHGRVVRLVP